MTLDRKPPTKAPLLPFGVWKMQLRKDCELNDKVMAFDAMGDYALRLFWESRVDPSVDGILGYSTEPKSKAI